jgi:hypothetical protein
MGENRLRRLTPAVVVAAVAGMVMLAGTPADAVSTWTPTPPIDRCTSLDGYLVTPNGRFDGCADLSLASAWIQQRLGSSGLHPVDGGSANAPGPLACVPGKVLRADGWTWTCTVRGGQPLLVKSKAWVRPVQYAYRHSPSATRSAVTLSANVPLEGCRVSASSKDLLRGQATALTGRDAQLTLDTSRVKPGLYSLGVDCRNGRLTSASDLYVRPDRSTLLRSDCIDAWHDGRYADIVPGYGRRLSSTVAAKVTSQCRKLNPITLDEMARAGMEAYVKIGQIAEREVRRVSATQGIPICQAIGQVFKPVDTSGHAVDASPLPYLDSPRPTAGYLQDGFFPALYNEWTGGPVAMQNIADCTTGNEALQLNAGYITCDSSGAAAGGSQDPHQTYPWYVFVDRATCPQFINQDEINPNIVCIVWGDRIGNNTVGGTGKVFVAEAMHDVSPFDCQDRALRAGQFVNVDVRFAPPLK